MSDDGAAMRPAQSAFGLIFLIASSLAFAPCAGAGEVTLTSASPYQLGDLLRAASPIYDVKISADLVYPDEGKAVMPAFVFVHGSSGRLLRHQRYLELARELGFATLQIDSFGPRGTGSTVGNQSNVTAAMMTVDVLRALKFLAERPNIDPRKIVIMGSSKGAIAALYASWNPIRKKVVDALDFAGYILLYPLCTNIEDGNVTASSVHIFMGDKDNWTPAAPCIAQVNRMKTRGRNWAITLYEGAYHAFDAPIDGVRDVPQAYSMVECSVALRADGYEYETGSGFLLTKAERGRALSSCARKGAVKIGGYHAAEALIRDIRAYLGSVFDSRGIRSEQ
jgi:dienelactone hydrolase